MKNLHCPRCGTGFVRVIHDIGSVERVLNRVNIFSFRCQLCTNRFRAKWPGARESTQLFDRREYKRLAVSFPAVVLVDYPRVEDEVTDLSMGGCTLQTQIGLGHGTFLELRLRPALQARAITVDTAMVCSVRTSSMGVRFLEIQPEEQRRLSRLILALLAGRSNAPHANA